MFNVHEYYDKHPEYNTKVGKKYNTSLHLVSGGPAHKKTLPKLHKNKYEYVENVPFIAENYSWSKTK